MTEQRIEMTMLSRLDSDQKAIAARVDSVDKTLYALGREVSEISGKIKSPTETPVWITYFVYPAAVLIMAALVTAVIRLTIQMNAVEHFLRDNGGFIAGLRLEKINPSDPKKVQEAKLIISQAKATKTAIPSEIIKKTGDKFLEAAGTDPDAWGAALTLADYRSYLNGPKQPSLSGYYPFGTNGNPDHLESVWVIIPTPPGARSPDFTTSIARVDIAVAARIDVISKPLPQNAKKGPASLLGVGGAVDLSGMYLRHVVLYNVEIHYNGGPLMLDDVTFVSCHFVMNTTTDTRELVTRLLASQSVQFTG